MIQIISVEEEMPYMTKNKRSGIAQKLNVANAFKKVILRGCKSKLGIIMKINCEYAYPLRNSRIL